MKTLLKRTRRPFSIHKFLSTQLSDIRHESASAAPLGDPEVIDLVTIAFNTPWVIHEQTDRIRKNLKDPFAYTVFDNSTDNDAAEAISQFCHRSDVGYVRLPTNPLHEPSESHGLAITWAWRNFLQPRKARYIGFLDHDVFPITPTSVISLVSHVGVYGHQQDRPGVWYLWPGFCFFARDTIKGKRLNFLPGKGTDTGGRLWRSLYRHMDRHRVPPAPHRYAKVGLGDDPQSDLVEYIGDWMHVINGSNWKAAGDKSRLVAQLLRKKS